MKQLFNKNLILLLVLAITPYLTGCSQSIEGLPSTDSSNNSNKFNPSSDENTEQTGNVSPCSSSPKSLCLQGGDIEITVEYYNHNNGQYGEGYSIQHTKDSGHFYFFDRDNLEVSVKALDAYTVNRKAWISFGALTDLEFKLKARNTRTGEVKTYTRERAQNTFKTCGALDTEALNITAPLNSISSYNVDSILRNRSELNSGPCSPNNQTLCLLDGRFKVQVDFKSNSTSSFAKANVIKKQTNNTGFFSFFHEDNIELTLKVLDGTSINGDHWVFYGSMTDREYKIKVTDLQTGQVSEYHNPQGNNCGFMDTQFSNDDNSDNNGNGEGDGGNNGNGEGDGGNNGNGEGDGGNNGNGEGDGNGNGDYIASSFDGEFTSTQGNWTLKHGTEVDKSQSLSKITAEFQLYHGGWHGDAKHHVHGIFWLTRGDKWSGDVLSWVPSSGNRNFVKLGTNIGEKTALTPGNKASLNGFSPGKWYTVKYVYNATARNINIRILDGSNEIVNLSTPTHHTAGNRLTSPYNFYTFHFGHASGHVEAPTKNWKLRNLKMKFYK